MDKNAFLKSVADTFGVEEGLVGQQYEQQLAAAGPRSPVRTDNKLARQKLVNDLFGDSAKGKDLLAKVTSLKEKIRAETPVPRPAVVAPTPKAPQDSTSAAWTTPVEV